MEIINARGKSMTKIGNANYNKVVAYAKKNSPCSQVDICRATGLSSVTVAKHLARALKEQKEEAQNNVEN